MKRMGKLVAGVGINDADYVTHHCPFRRKWVDLLHRVYARKYPWYAGVTVCDEWLTFSNFKKWMETQDWENKELDKDILVKGNKVYSPETCVFVDKRVNRFIIQSQKQSITGTLQKSGKYRAQGTNPLTKKRVSLGCYDSAKEAENAWKKYKLECVSLLNSAGLLTQQTYIALLERFNSNSTKGDT